MEEGYLSDALQVCYQPALAVQVAMAPGVCKQKVSTCGYVHFAGKAVLLVFLAVLTSNLCALKSSFKTCRMLCGPGALTCLISVRARAQPLETITWIEPFAAGNAVLQVLKAI